MQDGIHPKYVETTVTCGCGESFQTRSTLAELKVDICSKCHPFYTGKIKHVDREGRIERFKTRFAAGSYSSLKQKKVKQPKKKAEEL